MCPATKKSAERASVSTPTGVFLVLQGVNFPLLLFCFFFFCIDQDILRETPGRKKKKGGKIGHRHPVLDGGAARGARLISRFSS